MGWSSGYSPVTLAKRLRRTDLTTLDLTDVTPGFDLRRRSRQANSSGKRQMI